MKNQKFTKGEWHAVDYAGSYCIQNGPDYADKDLLSYASICGEDVSTKKEEVEANVKLITAAPDLLDALIELIDINESTEDFDTKVSRMVLAIKNSKSAIKKATGEGTK